MIPHDPSIDEAFGAQVWRPLLRTTFLDPDGREIPSVAPITPAGKYESDASRWPRTTVELNLPTAITPGQTASPVSPYGGGLLVDVGVEYLGASRWFRLATLDVVETTIDRPEGTIVVKAASHEARVDEDRIDTRSSTSAGTGTALVTSLVRRTLGNAHPVDNRVPPGSDPTYAAGAFRLDGGVWQTVEAIADASGFVAWFDAMGTLVLAPHPVKGTPSTTYRTGDGGTLTGYRSVRGWAYNRVAQRYEDDAGARIVGVWQDTNAASPTRVGGPYGRHTHMPDVIHVDTGKLPSQAVADKAAASVARRNAAGFRTVTLRTIPAPWVECGDTVAVGLLGGMSETLLVARHEFALDGLDVGIVTAAADDTTTSALAAGHAHPTHPTHP